MAVGNVLRRLASKITVNQIVPILRQELTPDQLGVRVIGGCENAAHAIREFVEHGMLIHI